MRATTATNALDHQADIAKVRGVAGAFEHCDHAAVRSPQNAAGG